MKYSIEELKPGDTVYYLHSHTWQPGRVKNINQKTITIDGVFCGSAIRLRIPKERCAHPQEEVALIWELWRGVNGGGAYRVEREQYSEQRRPAKEWKRQGHCLVEDRVDGEIQHVRNSGFDIPSELPYNNDC